MTYFTHNQKPLALQRTATYEEMKTVFGQFVFCFFCVCVFVLFVLCLFVLFFFKIKSKSEFA